MTEQVSNSSAKQLPGAFELFSPSVTAIGKNVGSFIGLLGVSIGVIFVAAAAASLVVLATVASDGTDQTAFIVELILAMSVMVAAAYLAVLPLFTYLQLRSSQGVQLGFSALFRETRPYFWRLVGLRLLLGLLYFVGILLFIVPFFFFWKRYMLSRYYVVDKNMSVSEAMAASAADSQKYAPAVWGVVGVRTLWWVVTQVFGLVGSVVDFLYSCAPSLRYLQIQDANRGKSK